LNQPLIQDTSWYLGKYLQVTLKMRSGRFDIEEHYTETPQ
jgi:hypothetical protein